MVKIKAPKIKETPITLDEFLRLHKKGEFTLILEKLISSMSCENVVRFLLTELRMSQFRSYRKNITTFGEALEDYLINKNLRDITNYKRKLCSTDIREYYDPNYEILLYIETSMITGIVHGIKAHLLSAALDLSRFSKGNENVESKRSSMCMKAAIFKWPEAKALEILYKNKC